MRYLLTIGLLVIALQCALGVPAVFAQNNSLDQIVAVVGDDVILASELETAVNRIRARADKAGEMPADRLRSRALDQLIMARLQVQRADQRGIQVSDAEIEQGLTRIARQNNLSMAQFRRAVAADGMSMDQLREQVRQQIKISKLRRDAVMSKVVVTDNDVDHYLENKRLRVADDREYRLRHIAIPAAKTDDASARDRIQTLRARITRGKADFAAVAADQSRDQQAANGGDLGWISGAYMPELFAEVLPGMRPGDVSEVFRGGGKFHLVKLEAIRGGDALDTGDKIMVDEVKARHILLKPNEIRNDERTRQRARQLRQRLEAGDDFAALARKYSDDGTTANQGGDLGWVRPSRFESPTRRQLTSLDTGEISPIFQTRDGYEIIQVRNRRQRDQTREAIRNRARQALGRQKSQEEGEMWLRKIRDEAYVDIRVPNYQPANGS